MRDDISIGSAPCEEDCVQVNPEGDYHEAMKAECRRFLELIRKKLGPEPEGARLAIKANPHDFGTYYEVVCYFEDSNEEAREYALLCEAEAPMTWKDDTLTPEQKAYHEARRAAQRSADQDFEEALKDPLAEEIQADRVEALNEWKAEGRREEE